MEKKEILEQLSTLVGLGVISRSEIIAAYEAGNRKAVFEVREKRKIGVVEILYGIGGAIVFLGIALLVGMNWSTLGDTAKIGVTLGVGVLAYMAGVIMATTRKMDGLANAFFFVSALVIPTGLFVTLHLFEYVVTYGSASFVSGFLLAFFMASYGILRKNVFVLFGVIYGTWFFLTFTSFMLGGQPLFKDWWIFLAYRILAIGISYLFLGASFRGTEREPLTGALFGFGILGFLGSALMLGDWTPHQNVFWELAFPGLTFGILFLSIPLKAKSFLVFGSGFLMLYILKITAEYFKSGLGWPMALVVAGFMLMAVGFGAYRLNEKYLSAKK